MGNKETQISVRGKMARKMVHITNHMPVIGQKAQSGELRKIINEHERNWKSPDYLVLRKVDMETFQMEYLTSAVLDKIPPKSSEKKVILHLHGGGYQGTLHNTYRDMAVIYHNINGNCDVLSVDYRVAPKHPYPCALEDALAAYQWLLDYHYLPENIVVAGDSAGGGLGMSLIMYLRDHSMPLPLGLVAMSPWTDLTLSGKTHKSNYDNDPMFGSGEAGLLDAQGYVGEEDPCNPYISPFFGEFDGFPPMLIQVGGRERLLDDSLRVVDKAKQAGVKVHVHVYPEMFHVFQMGGLLIPESKTAWKEVRQFLKWIGFYRR